MEVLNLKIYVILFLLIICTGCSDNNGINTILGIQAETLPEVKSNRIRVNHDVRSSHHVLNESFYLKGIRDELVDLKNDLESRLGRMSRGEIKNEEIIIKCDEYDFNLEEYLWLIFIHTSVNRVSNVDIYMEVTLINNTDTPALRLARYDLKGNYITSIVYVYRNQREADVTFAYLSLLNEMISPFSEDEKILCVEE